jgi:20S proteasome subunit alpha 7
MKADAGLIADGRQLVNRARHECQTWKKNYGESISIQTLASHMGQFIHLHTCYWAYRPFGSSLLIAGYDKDLKTHQLYSIDHNGDNIYTSHYFCI